MDGCNRFITFTHLVEEIHFTIAIEVSIKNSVLLNEETIQIRNYNTISQPIFGKFKLNPNRLLHDKLSIALHIQINKQIGMDAIPQK